MYHFSLYMQVVYSAEVTVFALVRFVNSWFYYFLSTTTLIISKPQLQI